MQTGFHAANIGVHQAADLLQREAFILEQHQRLSLQRRQRLYGGSDQARHRAGSQVGSFEAGIVLDLIEPLLGPPAPVYQIPRHAQQKLLERSAFRIEPRRMPHQFDETILGDILRHGDRAGHPQGKPVHGVLVAIKRLAKLLLRHPTLYIANSGLSGYGRAIIRFLKLLTTLRIILILHTIAVLTQSVFAGQFLSGIDSQVVFHERSAYVILALALAQIALSALGLKSGVGSLWLLFGSTFVFLAEGLQMGTGYGRFLGVHVPLGVIVFGALMWQTSLAFRSESSRT